MRGAPAGLQVVGTDFQPGDGLGTNQWKLDWFLADFAPCLGVVLIFHGWTPVCEPACGSRVLTMGSAVGHLPCFWAGSPTAARPRARPFGAWWLSSFIGAWLMWLTKSDDFGPGLGDLVWFSSFMVWRRCVARLRLPPSAPGS